MPKKYAGLGPDTLVPVVLPEALGQLTVGAEEGFVLSRIDGRTSVADICLLVPFDPELTVTILKRLFALGAIDIPGAIPPPTKPLAAPDGVGLDLTGIDLTLEQAQRIDAVFAALETRSAFELLEVQRGADKKEIKRAYFKLSKEFHPDRYFNKNVGPYKERLSRIFQAIKAAFELLNDDTRRAAYQETLQRK
jgi:hypothetical protein